MWDSWNTRVWWLQLTVAVAWAGLIVFLWLGWATLVRAHGFISSLDSVYRTVQYSTVRAPAILSIDRIKDAA